MTLTIDLPDEQAAALTAKAQAHGVSAEEYARQVLAHDLDSQPRRRMCAAAYRQPNCLLRFCLSRFDRSDRTGRSRRPCRWARCSSG